MARPPTREERIAKAVVGLAGLEAERRHWASVSRFALEHDWAKYWGLVVRDGIQAHDHDAALALGTTPAEATWWRLYVETTVELVGLWWPAVERVALELHRRGRLEGERVHELVGEERPGEAWAVRTRLRRARAAAACCGPHGRVG